MPKQTAFQGKRRDPLLASSLQQASTAVDPGTIEDLAAFVSTKAADSAVVHNTGDETVVGLKTFTKDIEISDKVQGLILIDRATDAKFRLFINAGVLGIEPVV